MTNCFLMNDLPQRLDLICSKVGDVAEVERHSFVPRERSSRKALD